MKVEIVAVGTKMPSWVQEGYSEYAKRLPKDICPRLIELPLAGRTKTASTQTIKELEAKKILSSLPDSNHVIALDVLGKSLNTEALSEKLSLWQFNGVHVSLIVGGPDGLSDSCLARANEKWSLSAMTLPHPLVRVMLIEQLYRAWTILQNHPYHK